MRIVYMGSGEFGLPTLRALHAAHEVALVVSQPDRPAGRRRRPTPTPVAAWAAEHGAPLLTTDAVNAPDTVARIADLEPDVLLVIAFGQKIAPALVDAPRLAAINLHGSLLPALRGAAPINHAILEGHEHTGLSVITLAQRMDAGEILGVATTDIDPHETAGELHDRLARLGPALVLDVLGQLDDGTVRPAAQDESKATRAPKLSRADGWVDFTATAAEVRRRIHGLTPWPGVTAWWSVGPDGERHPLRLCRAKEAARFGEPGEHLGDGVVATGAGAVELLEVQPPGKRVMSWSDFARGHDVPTGARFHRSAE